MEMRPLLSLELISYRPDFETISDAQRTEAAIDAGFDRPSKWAGGKSLLRAFRVNSLEIPTDATMHRSGATGVRNREFPNGIADGIKAKLIVIISNTHTEIDIIFFLIPLT